MKKIDVTYGVMQKIARFEKRRVTFWVARFLVIIMILGTGALLFAWASIQEIVKQQTGELLALFTEDREIIVEYWRDVVLTVWEELPRQMLVTSMALFGVAVGIFWVTRRSRAVLKKKFSQVKTYLSRWKNYERRGK